MWGSWGDLVFELVKTPTEFTERWGMDLKEQPIFGKKRSIHFVGYRNKAINATIKVYRSEWIPSVEDYIKTLEDKLKTREVNPLIVGDRNLGNFALSDLEVKYLQTDKFGRLVLAEINLTFKEVPDGTLDRQYTATS